jgi:hypothetical protein
MNFGQKKCACIPYVMNCMMWTIFVEFGCYNGLCVCPTLHRCSCHMCVNAGMLKLRVFETLKRWTCELADADVNMLNGWAIIVACCNFKIFKVHNFELATLKTWNAELSCMWCVEYWHWENPKRDYMTGIAHYKHSCVVKQHHNATTVHI